MNFSVSRAPFVATPPIQARRSAIACASAFWSPRRDPKRKISLTLWFHQALDVLWIANGVIFVVLLFVTGQWMRIVPTSWEVFPNAVSAALQYVSLDWPTENGWLNYNALQQLAYFAITFVAAPLAIVASMRGFRCRDGRTGSSAMAIGASRASQAATAPARPGSVSRRRRIASWVA